MGKSQISIFVIIGLVLIFIVGFVVIRINKERLSLIKLDSGNTTKEIVPVQDYVNKCLKKIAIEGLITMGDQGMLYPVANLTSTNAVVAYYYYKGQGFFPANISYFEKELSRYIQYNMKSCVGDFSRTRQYVYDDYYNISVSVFFEDKKAKLLLKYPMIITVKNERFSEDTFYDEVAINFNQIYELSRGIYLDTLKNPDIINLDIMQNMPFDIRIINVNPSTLVYEINDNNYGIEGQPYRFRFAMKYVVGGSQ